MNATQVADNYLRDLADTDADAAALLGRELGPLPQVSPDAFDDRDRAARRALAALGAASTDGPGEATLAAALDERLRSEIALFELGFTTRLLAPLATPVHLIRETFDNLPRADIVDWEQIAAALGQVPAALDDYAATLRRSAARGQLVAGRQIRGVAAQCRRWADPDGDDFYPSLVGSAQVPATLGSDLRRAAADAATATSAFAAFLIDDLLPGAGETDAVGRDLYAVTSSAFLGAAVDLDETYAYGWSELRRIRSEIAEAAAEITPEGTEAAFAILDRDPTQQVTGSQSLQRWLDERVGQIADAVDGVHFDLPAVARLPECRITEADSGVMYYTPPDALLTRPGRVFWTRPVDAAVTHTWREVTTVHHESIPGHHLQTVTALTHTALHPWQRSLCHIHGYVEGWAHYAEFYCGDIGLLRGPGERLGMLLGQAWRAARIVIDAGLHLDLPIPRDNGITTATRWTPEVGVAFLTAAAGVDPTVARFEVDRYLGWPAQALAFRVGAKLWSETFEAAKQRAGSGFDARKFHTDTLSLGPMGLGPMRDLVLGG